MLKVNISNTWKNIKYGYVNVNNSWKKLKNMYVNISGVWKPLWSYSWYIGNWSDCSAECGGGIQTRTVYCKRNDNVQVDDNFCSGTKPATQQSCNTQSCSDCRYDDSNITDSSGVTSSFNFLWMVSTLILPRIFTPYITLYWNYTNVYNGNNADITSVNANGYQYSRGNLGSVQDQYYYLYEICRNLI